MDDFTSTRVRQIASFPQVPAALPDDLVLLQRCGLGGPFISLPLSTVLGTALANAPTPGSATSGGPAPGIGLTYGAPVSFGQNWPINQPGAGPTYVFTAGAPGPAGFSMNAALTVSGDITSRGNVDGLGVFSAGMPVATINFVMDKIAFWSANAVLSWNKRVGAVELTREDLMLAGGAVAFDFRCQGTCLAPTHWNPQQADDTIATALFVQNVFNFAFEEWIGVQNPVLSFNGRGGNVALTLADVSAANNSIAGQYPTAPTPPGADNSLNVATTAFVTAAVAAAGGGFLPLTGGTLTGPVIYSYASPTTVYNAVAAGQVRAIVGETASVLRWRIVLGDAAGETGANAGSNFDVSCYTDAGATLFTPISIPRATGNVVLRGSPTNDQATAGNIGEVLITSVTAGVTLTSGAALTVGTVALTGGDWDVDGVIVFAPAATTTVSALAAAVNINGNALPTVANLNAGITAMNELQAAFTTGVQQVLYTGKSRWQVSAAASPQNYNLIAMAAFGVAAMTVTGFIRGRRAR